MPLVGEDFPISVVLENKEDSLFVRAYLRDADDNPLPYSPLSLPNLGNGLYLAKKPYPDTDYVSVVYECFEDSFFVTPAPYFSGGETFTREVETVNEIATNQIITEINEYTKDQMNRLAFADVNAEVDQDQEISVTLEQNEVTVVVETSEISVMAESGNEVQATVEQDSGSIDAEVSQDDKIDANVSDC